MSSGAQAVARRKPTPVAGGHGNARSKVPFYGRLAQGDDHPTLVVAGRGGRPPNRMAVIAGKAFGLSTGSFYDTPPLGLERNGAAIQPPRPTPAPTRRRRLTA
jgi:hypothetical protein